MRTITRSLQSSVAVPMGAAATRFRARPPRRRRCACLPDTHALHCAAVNLTRSAITTPPARCGARGGGAGRQHGGCGVALAHAAWRAAEPGARQRVAAAPTHHRLRCFPVGPLAGAGGHAAAAARWRRGRTSRRGWRDAVDADERRGRGGEQQQHGEQLVGAHSGVVRAHGQRSSRGKQQQLRGIHGRRRLAPPHGAGIHEWR